MKLQIEAGKPLRLGSDGGYGAGVLSGGTAKARGLSGRQHYWETDGIFWLALLLTRRRDLRTSRFTT
ncbi:MAG: hypothetical protein HPY44_20335 [Armatimonadetes bacterium]|nr:hypothetical protein [Armatimonadota bacterium]